MVQLLLSRRRSEGKWGQSVRSSASAVRYPHEGRSEFLTRQKFIRPSDCRSGEVCRLSFPPVHCTNTSRQTTHDKAENRPDPKQSRSNQNSAQNRTKIAQCMPSLSCLVISHNTMMITALFLLLMGLLANGQELRWENTFDKPLDFTCPPGQSISYIKSEHHNHYEDRLWKFGCKDTFDSGSDCFLSPYANDFDQPLNFECPPHHIITGLSSYHNNKHEDRRWQFNCCRSNHHCTADCEWTTYVNCFDELFHWTVPNHNYLVGAESYHDNNYEDRRWKYKYCSKVQC